MVQVALKSKVSEGKSEAAMVFQHDFGWRFISKNVVLVSSFLN